MAHVASAHRYKGVHDRQSGRSALKLRAISPGARVFADLPAYRDELVIATTAAYYMWREPFVDWRKRLIASGSNSCSV